MTKFPKQNNLIQEKIKMLLAGLHVGQSILGKTALTMAQGYRLLQVPLYVLLGLSQSFKAGSHIKGLCG